MEQPSDAEGEAAAASWEEMLEEAVIKHERGSERQLYVYGISAHRCPQCRSRIKPSSKQCEACRFTHNVELKCRRCMGEAIAMWCYECDAHYCIDCYSRPHVLSLAASGMQHSCFPIENSSGKCLGKGSWNQDFAAMTRSIYRLRISEKLAVGAAGELPDEDALLSAVLVDFNAINAHVMKLESTIQAMMNAVRISSFQDVVKASALNAKITEHRGVLELARARRTRISARVMMYLPAVIEFARGADRNSWGDVPRVLTTCQTRLAQLAGDMSGWEQRVLQLRGLIDEAVTSNDVRRIMQVQELGDQLKRAETRLDGLKTERDNQFVLMIKFSRELREAVQQEVAALSRGARAAADSARSA